MAEKTAKGLGAVKRALQSVIAPDMQEPKSGLRSVDTEVESLRDEMGSMHRELKSDSARLEEKIDPIAQRFDVVKEIEKLRIEVAGLKRRP